MPHFSFNNKNVYYEIHGEGKPIIILNGIMMSHLSWGILLPEMCRNNKIILVDFFDQGKTDKLDEEYTHSIQVELVKALIDEINIEKVNLVGISYGAEIALQFAIKYADVVNKLMVFNVTSATGYWLQDIGRAWVNAAHTYDPETFYNVTIPCIYSPGFYNKCYEWMNGRRQLLYPVFNKEFLDAMVRLIRSSEGYDVKGSLKEIKADTLVVGAEYDYITPVFEQEYISKNIPLAKFVLLKDCGHASMYEKPDEFISLINGFVGMENKIRLI